MKKTLFILMCLIAGTLATQAQRFAFIDTEYIMDAIPAYKQATQQLETASKKWQAEVEAKSQEAKKLYETYQSRAKSLSESQRTAQENAIIAKEKETVELRQKYFGAEGEMAKLQEKLMSPIQDAIYDAVKQIAESKKYAAVVDRAAAQSVLYASPSIDISDDVLAAMGYSAPGN